MAAIPLSAAPKPLDIVTICKADHWVTDVLPRFAGRIDACCSGVVRRHLLLITEATASAAAEGNIIRTLLAQGWHTVACRPHDDLAAGPRLLAFDALRAGLLGELGLREALYMDPDTDVVADLQGIQDVAPQADLLWVANPLTLEPVLSDLTRHGFIPAGSPDEPVLMEPGFMYLRRDLHEEFTAAHASRADVNAFVPGSTYWNMVMLDLGPKAVRLPDHWNRTFWDVPAAVVGARTVHFTGQWKRLQPHLEYDRPGRRIIVHPDRVPPPPVDEHRIDSLAVVALFRDNADYLPHAFSRFEAWERAGLRVRYYFLENDSTDATAARLAEFMQGRPGQLESRSLATRYVRSRGGENHDRIMPLARMRTFMLDRFAADPPPSHGEWALLLDSQIFFPDDILDRMMAARARDPLPASIGMLTCYTQQLFRSGHAPGILAPCPMLPEWSIADHYFDTFAFQDAHHRHFHPHCGFARCRRCRAATPSGAALPLIPPDRPIVDVAAAFGGLALVPSRFLRDPRIRWTTYGSGFDDGRVLSEHVVFCDRLRTITGTRVVVLQDVDCVYRL